MVTLTKIRELGLSAAATPGRPLHLSAASGLVCLDSFIFVVADDELHLGVFSASGPEPGRLLRLFDGVLPDSKSARKKQKPDFEALVRLPAFGAYRNGALLALGSGSRRNRRLGALLELDPRGAVLGLPRVVDLSPLLDPLEGAFPALNIEGAVAIGDELRLFQRGNKRNSANAIVRFRLDDVLAVLGSSRGGAVDLLGVETIDLGQIDGIPYGITDAAALPDGAMIMTAVAENTDNAYDDGPCAGAVVAIADNDGRISRLHRLDRPHKIEGVDARRDGAVVRLLLVTDADDSDIPAGLFSATLKL
jgi:hypothetical protein